MKHCNLLAYHDFKAKKERSLWHHQWLDIYWYGIPRTRLTGGIPTGNVIAILITKIAKEALLWGKSSICIVGFCLFINCENGNGIR